MGVFMKLCVCCVNDRKDLTPCLRVNGERRTVGIHGIDPYLVRDLGMAWLYTISELTLSFMFRPKCYWQNDRTSRGII
jgi:hypothetical protein